MGRSKKKKSRASVDTTIPQQPKPSNFYEGERLIGLLKSIHSEIESAKLSKGAFPEKVWIKQQFSIGVNDVTRVLERMPPIIISEEVAGGSAIKYGGRNEFPVQLQAVLLACDCNPRWLTKHIPTLASSRGVPLVIVKDKKGGSLRLGELVNLKSAIAVGVKAKGSGINKLVAEILESNERGGDTEMCQVGSEAVKDIVS